MIEVRLHARRTERLGQGAQPGAGLDVPEPFDRQREPRLKSRRRRATSGWRTFHQRPQVGHRFLHRFTGDGDPRGAFNQSAAGPIAALVAAFFLHHLLGALVENHPRHGSVAQSRNRIPGQQCVSASHQSLSATRVTKSSPWAVSLRGWTWTRSCGVNVAASRCRCRPVDIRAD